MIPLSEKTQQLVSLRFHGERRNLVTALLETHCADNLPSHAQATPESLERIRFAALKVAGKDIEKLRAAVGLAGIDWRDLLVAAGFELTVDAHEEWFRAVMKM